MRDAEIGEYRGNSEKMTLNIHLCYTRPAVTVARTMRVEKQLGTRFNGPFLY